MGNFLKGLFKITLIIKQSFSLLSYNVLRYVNIALVEGRLKNFTSGRIHSKEVKDISAFKSGGIYTYGIVYWDGKTTTKI